MKRRILAGAGAVFLAVLLGADFSRAAEGKVKFEKAPAFPRKGIWLNTEPLSRKIYKDKLTLVYFWDYTSVNCLRQIGLLKRWSRQYYRYGFRTVWVHAPEFDFARRRDNVEQAVRRLKISGPVLLDNEFKLWDGFKTSSWPTKYLVDSGGRIVYSQVGEEGDLATEEKIREELKKTNPAVLLTAPVLQSEPQKFSIRSCGPMVSETYVGYKRSGWWGGQTAGRDWVPADRIVSFKDRGERVERGFFAEGLWANREDHLEHARDTNQLTDYVGILYIAHEVYGVAHRVGETGATRIYVSRDEQPVPFERRGADLHEDPQGGTYFLLQEPRLYYLIAQEDEDRHELKLSTHARGVAVNSFSFSNHCLSNFEHL